MLEILKFKQVFLGLEAPLFAWVAAAILISFTLGCFFFLFRGVSRLVRQSSDAATAIRALRQRHPTIATRGLDFEAYDELSSIFEGAPVLKPAWRRYRALRVTRRNAEGGEEAWSGQSADCAFTEAAIVEPAVNLAFFTALPGIVTGAGLLCTFLAILVALLDVRLTNNRVQGLELLIQGLSGKFVSSIAALGAATLYLLGERPLLYRLTRSRHELIGELDDLVPVLSQSQALTDVSRDLSDQTVAFSTFNADLSLKLRQSFSESMGPTLERMVTAIEQLNTHLRVAEAQKQASITGSIETLVDTLQRSLTETLGDMGSKFKDALSGGAMNEFQRVTDSLEGTAKLLESMNEQSKSTQLALNDLVNFATKSTSQQIELGKSQVEDLTAVLRGLMTDIHQTTGSSMNAMTATLTAVVHELATKVSNLGDKMATSVGQSASAATGAATQVIEQANAWSAQSAQQLTQLLKEHEHQLGTVRDLRLALDQSLGGFQKALTL